MRNEREKRRGQAGVEGPKTSPLIVIENRTESKLLESVTHAFSAPTPGTVNMASMFARAGVAPGDSLFATAFHERAGQVNRDIQQNTYTVSSAPDNGVRRGTLAPFEPIVAQDDLARDIVDMTFLVAIQPEIPIPQGQLLPGGREVFPGSSTDTIDANRINKTIRSARLLAELIIDTHGTQDPDAITNRFHSPNTALFERYFDQRERFRDSIRPDLKPFEGAVNTEFFVDAFREATAAGRQETASTLTEQRVRDYREQHAGLPWPQQDTDYTPSAPVRGLLKVAD